MIAMATEKQHDLEFDRKFEQLFSELTLFARSRGINGCQELGGHSNAEDPEDFAQECLIEYASRARQAAFTSVQTGLIRRIARDRLVDAWRKGDRRPLREEFEACTKEKTDQVGSTDMHHALSSIPEFKSLSDKAVDILLLKYVGEWLDREIADALGMTVEGIRSSLKRSRQKLVPEHVIAKR